MPGPLLCARPYGLPMAAPAAQRRHRSAHRPQRSLDTACRSFASARRPLISGRVRGLTETLSRGDLLAQVSDETVGHRRVIPGATEGISPLTVGQATEQPHRPLDVARRNAAMDQGLIDRAVVELDVPIGDSGDESTPLEEGGVVLLRIESLGRPEGASEIADRVPPLGLLVGPFYLIHGVVLVLEIGAIERDQNDEESLIRGRADK